MNMNTKSSLLELAGSSGAGAHDVRGRCTDSLPMDGIIVNSYFLAPFYCSGQLIYSLKISGNKNNLRTI